MIKSGREGQLAHAAQWAIYGVATLLVVGRAMRYVYSDSFDLALHYDLVHSIYHHWGWPRLRPLWSTMHLYPPLAHYLGALIGVLVGSPMLGMNAVAAGAMFGCYVILTRAISVGSAISAAMTIQLAVVGLYLGRTQYAVEGFQTIYNYFFGHMAGDFAFLAFTLWLSQTPLDWKRRLAATAVATLIYGWLYPQTSVLTAAAYVSLEAILLLRAALKTRAFRPAQLIPIAMGLVVLPPIILLHPQFGLMVKTAINAGALPVGMLEDFMPELALALGLVSLILTVIAPEQTPWRKGALFLAAAGAAASSTTLIQVLALALFKAGSGYAVRKYAFVDVTLLVFGVAALAGILIDQGRTLRERPLSTALVSCLAGVAALFFLPVSNRPADLNRFVEYQRRVESMLAGSAPPEALRHIVSKDPDFGISLNHGETMVDLGMNPDESMTADLTGISANDKTPATWAIMSDRASKIPQGCIAPRSRIGFMVLAKLQCVHDWPIAPRQPMVLSDIKLLPAPFASGWSGNEGNGVWTLGKEAVFRLHVDHPTDPVRLTFDGPAFLPRADYKQRVELYVGDKLVGSQTFNSNKTAGEVTAVIPASMLQNGSADVLLKLPDATSPAQETGSGDTRVIAFFVTSVSLDK